MSNIKLNCSRVHRQ